jgi:hypothetical protein
VLKVEELELAALLQRTGEIPELAIHQGNNCALEQRLGDAPGNGARGGLPRSALLLLPIAERNGDLLARLGYLVCQSRLGSWFRSIPSVLLSRTSNLGIVSRLDLVEEVETVLNELWETRELE